MTKILLFHCFFWFTAVNAQTGIDKFDLKILQNVQAGRSRGETKFMRTISDANNYVNAAIPVGLLVVGIIDNNKDMRQNALYVATSSASTVLINFAIKNIFKRPRPFLIHISLMPIYKPSGYSFPSGHTSLSFSTASALSMAYPKWYVVAPSFLWAGAVGYSRVYLGVHNPSDVFAGAILGIGAAWGYSFMKR